MNDSTLDQLRAIARAARQFVDAVAGDAPLRQQCERLHGVHWHALVQTLFEGRSLQDRAMEQFNEQRDAALKRISASL